MFCSMVGQSLFCYYTFIVRSIFQYSFYYEWDPFPYYIFGKAIADVLKKSLNSFSWFVSQHLCRTVLIVFQLICLDYLSSNLNITATPTNKSTVYIFFPFSFLHWIFTWKKFWMSDITLKINCRLKYQM